MTDPNKIRIQGNSLIVPDHVKIPFIEGDGTGPDIWCTTKAVIDAAVKSAYNGAKRIDWIEIYAGEKAFEKTGEWLPKQTLEAIKNHVVAIKGPLSTPIGKGIRSLNVTIRQKLGFICVYSSDKIYSIRSRLP